MKSSLYLVIEEIRKKKKNKTKQKQMLHYETRHVSVMTTAATLKTLLNKIMIAIFNHWEFFVSGETEIWLFFFPKSTAFLFFSVPTPHRVKSSVSRLHPLLSRSYQFSS